MTSKHRKFVNQHRHLYDKMFEDQKGGCAICGSPPKTRRLHIDHDHKKMKIRGLLCFRCNSALKYWMDSNWLKKASKYVA